MYRGLTLACWNLADSVTVRHPAGLRRSAGRCSTKYSETRANQASVIDDTDPRHECFLALVESRRPAALSGRRRRRGLRRGGQGTTVSDGPGSRPMRSLLVSPQHVALAVPAR